MADSRADTRTLAQRLILNQPLGWPVERASRVQALDACRVHVAPGAQSGPLTHPLSAAHGEGPGTGASRTRAAAPGSPRVLLADDDDDLRAELAGLLVREGYQVVEAKDGDAMLDLLIDATPPDSEHVQAYDAIITDVVMPGFSGIDVLRAFRRSTAFIPSIIISALGDSRVTQAVESLGAVAFLRKPFDGQDLLRTLAAALDPSSKPVRGRPSRKPES
jgi:CheY-like chemotaxis protein